MSNSYLKKNKDWHFKQSSLKLHFPVTLVDKENISRKKTIYISGNNACREVIINQVRNKLRRYVYGKASVSYFYPSSWDKVRWYIDLERESLKQPGKTFLIIGKRHFKGEVSKVKVADFIKLSNILVAPLNVMLNPNRYVGNWWETEIEEALENNNWGITYYGIDNTIGYHPALVSLYLGLLRQCALLINCDAHKQIFPLIDYREVENCLNNSDLDLAVRIVKKMKPWIAVPPPAPKSIYGYSQNFATNFPVSPNNFSKLFILQNLVYKKGLDKAFNGSINNSWNIERKPRKLGYNYSGMYNYTNNKLRNKTNVVRAR